MKNWFVLVQGICQMLSPEMQSCYFTSAKNLFIINHSVLKTTKKKKKLLSAEYCENGSNGEYNGVTGESITNN